MAYSSLPHVFLYLSPQSLPEERTTEESDKQSGKGRTMRNPQFPKILIPN